MRINIKLSKILIWFWALLLSGSALAQSQYQFERMWPNLPQPWYFQHIKDMTTDKDGFIWLVDIKRDEKKLFKYTENGYLVKSFTPELTQEQIKSGGFEGYQAHVFGHEDDAFIKANDGYLYTLGTMKKSTQNYGIVGFFQFDLDFNFIRFINLESTESLDMVKVIDFAVDDNHFVVLKYHDQKWVRTNFYDKSGNYFGYRAIDANGDGPVSSNIIERVDLREEWVIVQRASGSHLEIKNIHRNSTRLYSIKPTPADVSYGIYIKDFYPVADDGDVLYGYVFYEETIALNAQIASQYRLAKVDESGYPIWTVDIVDGFLREYTPSVARVTQLTNGKVLISSKNGVHLVDEDGGNVTSFAAPGNSLHRFPISAGNNVAANDEYVVVLNSELAKVKLYSYGGDLRHRFELNRDYGNAGFHTSELLKIDNNDHLYVVQEKYYSEIQSYGDAIVKYDLNGNVLAVFKLFNEKAMFFKIDSFEVQSDGTIQVGVDFTPRSAGCSNCGLNQIRYYELDSQGEVTKYELLYDPLAQDLNLKYKQARGIHRKDQHIYVATLENTQDGWQHTFEIYRNTRLIKKINDFFPVAKMVPTEGGFILIGTENSGLAFIDYEGNLSSGNDYLFVQGSLPGQIEGSQLEQVHDITVTDNHLIIYDAGNYRLQIFKRVEKLSNAKAIIVAGGGPFAGNSLWDATLMNANFAYRTLISQGYSKARIKYLANENFDLDGNGELDDFAGLATNDNLQKAIQVWAKDADNLVVYLIDHGGSKTFRMGETEILAVESLNDWLTSLEGSMSGGITLLYDACKSGTFIDVLQKQDRVVITSAKGQENAYFLSQGSVSFSSFFWQSIFNGQDLAGAFANATETIHSIDGLAQNPQISFNGQLVNNELSRLNGKTIGQGTLYSQNAPVVSAVTDKQSIEQTSTATVSATISDDPDGIGRVWAVIWPPSFVPPDNVTPVLNLPTFELDRVGPGRYRGSYDKFMQNGTYQIAVYARDGVGNTAVPKATTVTVGSASSRKALLIGSGVSDDGNQSSINSNLHLAYSALKRQGYVDDEIYYIAAEVSNVGVDGLNGVANVRYGLSDWLGSDTSDLTVFVAGPGDHKKLSMSDGEMSSTQLGLWLTTAQMRISGTMTVLLDINYAGHWLAKLPNLPAGKRIIMASTNARERIYWLGGQTASFAEYFWRQVHSGSSVREAFIIAKQSMDVPGMSQNAVMDDNGNGIGNEKTEGRFARTLWLGSGLTTAGDEPLITEVAPPKHLNGGAKVRLYAAGVSSTSNITEVKAVVVYPHSQNSDIQSDAVILTKTAEGYYQGEFKQADRYGGYYHVIYTATNADGYVSAPVNSHFIQTAGADVHEIDNSAGQAKTYNINLDVDQWHTLHRYDDSDWVKVYFDAWEYYTIKVNDVGPRLDPQIKLYNASGKLVADPEDYWNTAEPEALIYYARESGFYYVQISHSDQARYTGGNGMQYSLTIESETGEFPGDLAGYVTYHNGDPVVGASLVTSNGMSAVTMPNGAYLISKHAPGKFKLTLTADGKSYKYDIEIQEAAIKIKDISIPNPGSNRPVVIAPDAIAISTDSDEKILSSHPQISEFLTKATATDANGSILTVSNDAPRSFEVGTTVVTFFATDSQGNSHSAQSSVWIDFIDNEKQRPQVTAPKDLVVTTSRSDGVLLTHPHVKIFLAAATATDSSGNTLPVYHDAPDLLPFGYTIVHFSATDSKGEEGEDFAYVTVNFDANYNAAPIFTSEPYTQAFVGQTYDYLPGAIDIENDYLRFAATKLPGWLTFNGSQLYGIPTVSDIGRHEVILTVTDGVNTGKQAFFIVVKDSSISMLPWLKMLLLEDREDK